LQYLVRQYAGIAGATMTPTERAELSKVSNTVMHSGLFSGDIKVMRAPAQCRRNDRWSRIDEGSGKVNHDLALMNA
jgi:hypothetical protein